MCQLIGFKKQRDIISGKKKYQGRTDGNEDNGKNAHHK